MSSLLYIEASPRKERSKSIEIAKEYLQVFRTKNEDCNITTLDLWELKMPEFTDERINAKYKVLHGQPHTPEEKEAWDEIAHFVEGFAAADYYLFSLPMWNFSIPYKLKHFIDIITQPGLAFTFSPETGYQGLITGKQCTVIYARGGEYASKETASLDYQKTYFQFLLSFIGFSDIQSITLDATLGSPEVKEANMAEALVQAREIAGSL
ncbi:FMN-dependent NADH-azoreductase [Halodesulfovibrio spirochaetisodalis]|uniref:FMN dependent NADH:quinone oxidoreductase n=1 Tax=Halodesulfovibrio spirochaetisodalis TaxID=1560234 RepID=A0A1B7XBH4_9BACT|nr:NAD(P)H-dependent oxidoreductase [Halodesulfovibrio spirochaetisodalis]OBQ50100.1 FMN-dependent NADH-azoreductase [Halodesulfovibrio spirochaetisodalis]